jgi:hypothetical protein
MDATIYKPKVAWRTKARSVVQVTAETVNTPATYSLSVKPVDVTELGASPIQVAVGDYVMDFIGTPYRITNIALPKITVSDDFRSGACPQSGQTAIVYRSVGDGNSPYLPPIYYRFLDRQALANSKRFELDILWKKLYAERYLLDPALWKKNIFDALVKFGVAIGLDNYIKGEEAIAIGTGNIASSFRELVLGSYSNNTPPNSATAWNILDILMSVGNGANEGSRHNALDLYKSGLVKLYNGLLIGEYVHGAVTPANGLLQVSATGIVQAWKDGIWLDLYHKPVSLASGSAPELTLDEDKQELSLDLSAYAKTDDIQAVYDATLDPTGFVPGQNIQVTYNKAARTITLTKTGGLPIQYLWRGQLKELANPWTSAAHATGNGMFYLYSTDGNTIAWSSTLWIFSTLMVALASVNGADAFGVRETHETMPYSAHQNAHNNIGTTIKPGGGKATAGTYTENTATDAANTPGFDQAVVVDEDNETTVPALTEGAYTTMRIAAGNLAVFDTTAILPFRAAGSFMLVNSPTTGAETATINNRFCNVYQILMPATADGDSQKYRMVFLQPQVAYTSLTSAQAEEPKSLKLGNLTGVSTEFVLHARITYVTATGDNNTGKCRIAAGGITYLAGNKISQLNVAGYTPNSHSALSELVWTQSGHTGTDGMIAGFGTNGAAKEFDIGDITTNYVTAFEAAL